MKGQGTVSRYRGVDLSLFALMLVVFEGIVVRAATRWFPGEPYTVSVVPLIVAIVMIRWGPWAGIHAVLGGAAFCFFSGAGAGQYAVYCIGNLFSLGALLLVRALGAETIRQDSLKTVVYGLAVLLLTQLGRGIVSLALGAGIGEGILFITTDVITDLFTLVILWIVRRLDGMLEDQYHYLARVKAEQEKEREGYR